MNQIRLHCPTTVEPRAKPCQEIPHAQIRGGQTHWANRLMAFISKLVSQLYSGSRRHFLEPRIYQAPGIVNLSFGFHYWLGRLSNRSHEQTFDSLANGLADVMRDRGRGIPIIGALVSPYYSLLFKQG